MTSPLQKQGPTLGPRIVIVGVTGSGKTTLARNLSAIIGIPYVELDAVHWLPNWVMVEKETFRQKVAEIVAADSWIVDGNYRKARDLIWARATTLIWLDYSFPVAFWQLLKRTIRRMITGEELWNGNRESFKLTFLSKDSILLWSIQSHNSFRKSYPQQLAQPENKHLQVIRLYTPRETRQLLNAIAQTCKTH